jgi:hypothetical protein
VGGVSAGSGRLKGNDRKHEYGLTRHLFPWSVNEVGERRVNSGPGLGMASYLP